MLDQIASIAGPFLIGLLLGVLAKRLISLAIVLIALFIALAAFGYISFEQVSALLQQLGVSAREALDYSMRIKNAIPHSSLAFLIGLAIGLWKG